MFSVAFIQPAGWAASQAAGQPSCIAITLALDIHANFSVKYYHTCHAFGHHLLLSFCTNVSDLDLSWDHMVSEKQILLALICSQVTVGLKFDVMLKQCKLNILMLFFSEIC